MVGFCMPLNINYLSSVVYKNVYSYLQDFYPIKYYNITKSFDNNRIVFFSIIFKWEYFKIYLIINIKKC